MKLGKRRQRPPCQIGSARLGGRETRTQLARSGMGEGKLMLGLNWIGEEERRDQERIVLSGADYEVWSEAEDRGDRSMERGVRVRHLGLDDLFACSLPPVAIKGSINYAFFLFCFLNNIRYLF
jgi:hypothetical protein